MVFNLEREQHLEAFSEEEKEVIHAFETIEPLTFIVALKQQKGSFVSSNERWAIKDVQTKTGISDSLLNAIIHYILVIKGSSEVSGALALVIAKDWIQRGVSSSSDAIIQMRAIRDEKRGRKNGSAEN